jgi:spore maturation protein CgeB
MQLKDYDLRIWGRKWEKSLINRQKPEAIVGLEARGVRQTAVFRSSIINLNTHHFDDINGANQRLFDICGCGGFQLVDHKKVIEEFYEPGQDLDVYSDAEELKEKVGFYLFHEKETIAMAKSAQKKTIANHTYDHRIKKIFDTLDFGSLPE